MRVWESHRETSGKRKTVISSEGKSHHASFKLMLPLIWKAWRKRWLVIRRNDIMEEIRMAHFHNFYNLLTINLRGTEKRDGWLNQAATLSQVWCAFNQPSDQNLENKWIKFRLCLNMKSNPNIWKGGSSSTFRVRNGNNLIRAPRALGKKGRSLQISKCT